MPEDRITKIIYEIYVQGTNKRGRYRKTWQEVNAVAQERERCLIGGDQQFNTKYKRMEEDCQPTPQSCTSW